MEEETETSASSTGGIAIYIDSGSGYELSSSTVFPTAGYVLNTENSICTNGGTISQDSETKAISVSVSSSDYCTLYYDKLQTLSEYVISLADTTTTPDFSTVATTDEGVFAMEDDYGTSYYFRGAATNNYVYFAGYYWRIVRVNGDGTIRIIYDGGSAYANGTSSAGRYIGTSMFNNNYASSAYVGYMYGNPDASDYDELQANTNDSFIKAVLDTWYVSILKETTYESYLADGIFCNDRSVAYEGYLDSWGDDVIVYGAYERLDTYDYSNYSPQLTCNQQNDAFTVDDTTYGNGDLTYPIGLITADEVSLAGAVAYTTNKNYYLYTGNNFWTMSPFNFLVGNDAAIVWVVDSSGYLDYDDVNGSNSVRPVINLKADVLISSGDGTMDSPFTLELAS